MDGFTYGDKMLFTITQYPAVESSPFNMKTTASVTKSLHLDCGPYIYVHSSLL